MDKVLEVCYSNAFHLELNSCGRGERISTIVTCCTSYLYGTMKNEAIETNGIST